MMQAYDASDRDEKNARANPGNPGPLAEKCIVSFRSERFDQGRSPEAPNGTMAFVVHRISGQGSCNVHVQATKTISFIPVQERDASGSEVSFQLNLVERGKSISDRFGKIFGSSTFRPKFHVVLSEARQEGDETKYFELYQGHDLTETESALESLRISLEPLLQTGTIDITADLLSELLLPSPKPVTELLSVFLRVEQKGRGSGIDTALEAFNKLKLLHFSCKKDDSETLKAHLESGADIQATDHHGSTPLHTAARYSPKCLKQLLLHVEETLTRAVAVDVINRLNHYGHTVLHIVCGNGNADAVEALVNAGAKLATQAIDNSGCYPLHFAAQYNHHECISAISRKYGYLNPDPHDAEKEKDKHEGLNSPDVNGDTPLLVAVRNQNLKSALALLLENADPNHPNSTSQDFPLHIAARECNITLVQLLFVFGAEPAPKNDKGKTPLEEAKEANAPHAQKEECIRAIKEVIQGHNEDTTMTMPLSEVQCRADDTVFILSLDGGGIRGLVLAQLIMAIDERMSRLDPHHRHLSTYFDWIAGTSTGAFLTLGFTRHKASPAMCRKLYFKFKNKALAGHRVYPADDIAASLKEAFTDTDVMTDIKGLKVIVTSCLTDHLPPKLHLFCNYGDARNGQLPPSETRIWEAARASSAAPTYFPAFANKFLDGGVIANNPTLDAMAEVLSEAQEGHNIKIGCVLSLGTGVAPVVPAKEISIVTPHYPSDILHDIEAAKNLLELFIDQTTLTGGPDITRAQAWCNSMGTPYFRFSPPIDNIELNETDDAKLIKMLFDTLIYTFKKRDEIDKLAKILLTKVN